MLVSGLYEHSTRDSVQDMITVTSVNVAATLKDAQFMVLILKFRCDTSRDVLTA